MSKPFLSYDQQVDKLIQEKNLIIDDREYAISFLKKVSYFALICGYKDPFKNTTTKKYLDGTKIDHIIELYRFDEALRALFLKYIMKIERNIRSLLSYYFCEEFGDDQNAYLDVNKYDLNPVNSVRNEDIHKLTEILKELAQSGNYQYISHHRVNHNNVPLWVLTNAMTFGQISKMYSFLQQRIKSRIAANFNGVMSNQLQKMLEMMTMFRNICAHGERLFSYRTRDAIPNLDLHRLLKIPKKGQEYLQGKSDLFAVVLMFRMLLYREDFLTFFDELKAIIERYAQNRYSLEKITLYKNMGFPNDWEDVPNL